MNDLQQRLETAIAELGSTREQVAARLKAEGIKGYCGEPFTCPVAKFLSQRLGGTSVRSVSASLNFIAVYLAAEVGETRGYVPTPQAVAAFILAFDQGSYPELMA